MRLVNHLALAMVMAAALPGVSHAQTGQRMSDKEVKQLIEDVDKARDRFEDQLDGKLKNSIVRSSSGEINVKQYLEDLQRNLKSVKERFTPTYAASQEVTTLLRQGNDVDSFMKAQPNTLKGQSEWDTMARQLARLAEAYRTSFPLPEGAPVRRINDGEAAQAAASVALQADNLKKAVAKDKGLSAQRDGLKKDLELLGKQAKVVNKKTVGGKPATSEAREVIALGEKVVQSLQGASLAAETGTAWSALKGPLDKMQQAYGMAAPR